MPNLGKIGTTAGEVAAEKPALWKSVFDRWGSKAPEAESAAMRAEGLAVTPDEVAKRLESKFAPAPAGDLDIEKAADDLMAGKLKTKPKAEPAPVAKPVAEPAVDVNAAEKAFVAQLHADPAKKQAHLKKYLEAFASTPEDQRAGLWGRTAKEIESRPASGGRFASAVAPKVEIVDVGTLGAQRPIYGLKPDQEVKLLGPANQVVTVPLSEAKLAKYKDYKLTDVVGVEFENIGPLAVPKGYTPDEGRWTISSRARKPHQLPAGEPAPAGGGGEPPSTKQLTDGTGVPDAPSTKGGVPWKGLAAGAVLGTAGYLATQDGKEAAATEPTTQEAAIPDTASVPDKATGSSVVDTVKALSVPTRQVAGEPTFEQAGAEGEYSKSQADFATAVETVQQAYASEKDSLAKRELMEKLVNGLGMLFAGLYGQKHGIDMSGTKFDKTDWAEKYRGAREDLVAGVNITKAKFEARKEAIEARKYDVDKRNQLALMKSQQQQRVYDEAFNKLKMEHDDIFKQAGLQLQSEDIANKGKYYDALISGAGDRAGKAADTAAAKKRADAVKFYETIQQAQKTSTTAQEKTFKAEAALRNQQFKDTYGQYLIAPNDIVELSPREISAKLMGN